MVSLGTLGLNPGVDVVHEPVTVLADGDDRGVAVLAGYTLDALDALFPLGTLGSVLAVLTIGHSEIRRITVAVGDRISVDETLRSGLEDGDDRDTLFALRTLRTLFALDALGLNPSIDVINKPVAVLADGDDRGMAILAGFALDALNTLGTLFALLPLFALGAVGHGEGRSGIIGISDCVCVDQAIRGGLDDGNDGDTVLAGLALVSLGALGRNTRIDVVDKPVAVLTDRDDRGMTVFAGFTLDALNALSSILTILTVLAVLTIGDGEIGRVTVGVGNGISVD